MNRTNGESDRTLWMGDLDEKWDANTIVEAFARMGEQVINVKLVSDKQSGKQAGYCFVEFPDRESARRAMLRINGKIMPKSKPPAAFNLSFANSPSAAYTEYNLFVNNLPSNVDDASLFLIFGERYESCRGAKVYRNTDGSSKGLGFVRFSNQTDQQRALLEMNKYRVEGRPIFLKLAQPKYRAPRQPKFQGVSGADTFGYYVQQQNIPDTSSYYNTGNASTTQHSNYPVSDAYSTPVANQSAYYSGVGSVDSYIPRGTLPIRDPTAEESNDFLVKNGEEFYEALERSRWSQVVCDANITIDDLIHSLS